MNNSEQLAETTKQCLFDMFGEDALVKNKPLKEGIWLDDSQLKVLNTTFRCDQPNFVTAFNEESVDMFPVDETFEKTLKVPSLDDFVNGCLTNRYGQKASLAKNKGKVLFTQPCKMVDKICFKGQHATRMGIVMQCYLQQGLGSLLTSVQFEDLDKEAIVQEVKDVFVISTKVLDQLGRKCACHHIARRAVAMTDTGLYEQNDNLQFSNLPLSDEGAFGPGLEPLLKKFPSDFDTAKRPRFESYGKPATSTTAQTSGTNWNNFRIPKRCRTGVVLKTRLSLDRPVEASHDDRGSHNNYRPMGFGHYRAGSQAGIQSNSDFQGHKTYSSSPKRSLFNSKRNRESLGKNVIEKVPLSQMYEGFYSTLFLVPKKRIGR
ncbi:hypothetical protein DPMN_031735 [Dreissena polymorpha]|uniref:Uncharacterized protein n=1 Tax=Dreissena polymorpha TaxID=45954 RepID=A0A9D4M2F4_DREPO|nr:hypothetical protein DPMN_031735 [Dreissena polymorpha]